MGTLHTMEELGDPKRRKRRRLRLKKLNPFRRKYKKFSEYDTNNGIEIPTDSKKPKKKSRARVWLNTAVGLVTFRSRRRRNRTNSNPISSRTRGRARYSSTGSLECLVTSVDLASDNDELQSKTGRKRAHSDPCLYQASKDLKKKKKSKTKRIQKVSFRACQFLGTGMVQAAGVFQYMSPMAGVPTAVGQGFKPNARPKATYYDNDRDHRRQRNLSDMQYSCM